MARLGGILLFIFSGFSSPYMSSEFAGKSKCNGPGSCVFTFLVHYQFTVCYTYVSYCAPWVLYRFITVYTKEGNNYTTTEATMKYAQMNT